MLDKLGVDKNFIENMYNKYSPYASKVGLSGGIVRNTLTAVEKAMSGKPESSPAHKKANDFDISKFPDL